MGNVEERGPKRRKVVQVQRFEYVRTPTSSSEGTANKRTKNEKKLEKRNERGKWRGNVLLGKGAQLKLELESGLCKMSTLHFTLWLVLIAYKRCTKTMQVNGDVPILK